MGAADFVLEPMTEAQFETYLEATLGNYAQDIARATGWALEDARTKARAQVGGLLPDGLMTAGHVFRHVLDDSGERAGAIWYGEQCEMSPARLFLYDIHLAPQARGRGLGTRLMGWLEEEARKRGLGAIGLSVFRHNAGAVRLYERLGFEVEIADDRGMALLKCIPEG